eukprot:TRINITY_DN500_c0_g1_i13.p1 TRINITY_DN500_c0_g1~~TRINITY_DN500_c0_g1_i13.p1  ORF type:complete len:371 (+),score=50.67 TRINITY_DN500_c0_g1_i13:720-1832(+)
MKLLDKSSPGPLIFSKPIAEQAEAEHLRMLGEGEESIPYRGLRTKGPLNIQTIPNDNFNIFYCVRSKQTRLIEDHHSIWRHVISGGIKQLLEIIIDEIGFCPNYFVTMVYKAWLNNPELKVYAYMDANQNCAVEDSPIDYTTSQAVRRMCGNFVELEYMEGCARYGLELHDKLDSFIRTKKFDHRSDYVKSWWNVLEARLEEHLSDEKSAVYQQVMKAGGTEVEMTLIGQLKGDQYQIDRIERMMILKDVRLHGKFNINRMHNPEHKNKVKAEKVNKKKKKNDGEVTGEETGEKPKTVASLKPLINVKTIQGSKSYYIEKTINKVKHKRRTYWNVTKRKLTDFATQHSSKEDAWKAICEFKEELYEKLGF